MLRGDWARAARLYGGAEAHSAETGIRRSPGDEAFLAPLVAKARAAMGAPAFSASEASGRSLTYAAALTEARAWLDSWIKDR